MIGRDHDGRRIKTIPPWIAIEGSLDSAVLTEPSKNPTGPIARTRQPRASAVVLGENVLLLAFVSSRKKTRAQFMPDSARSHQLNNLNLETPSPLLPSATLYSRDLYISQKSNLARSRTQKLGLLAKQTMVWKFNPDDFQNGDIPAACT